MKLRQLLAPLRLLVSGALIVYLIWRADPAKIWEAWRGADLALVALALALQLLGVAISAWKWNLILAGRGQQQPFRWVLGAYLAGQFANNILPTTVGGDALRVAQLGRRIGSYSEAGASVFLERLTGFIALSLIALAALAAIALGVGRAIATSPLLFWVTIGFSALAATALIAAFVAPRLLSRFGGRIPAAARRPMEKLVAALAAYLPHGGDLVRVLLVSLLFQTLWVAIHIVCGRALAIDAPPLLYALMSPITDILGLAPIFVNNLGAREAVFTIYLTQVGTSAATAVALAFLIFTVRLLVSLLGGLVILAGGADLQRARQDAPNA